MLASLFCMLCAQSVWGTEVTYSVTSTSAVSTSGTAPTGSSASYSSTYKTKSQLTAGNSMTLTLSGYNGKKITGLVLSMRSNSSKGAGNLSVTAGDATIASIATAKFNTASWYGAWSTSYVDVNVVMSDDSYVIQQDENVVITIAATENSLYCESFKLTYEDGGSSSLTANDLTLNASSKSFDLADGAGQTFQLSNSGSADGALSYESNNTAVATVSNTGLITAVAEGTATITVTQAASSTYNGGTATCTVTVTDSRYTISDLTFTATCSGSGTADDGAKWTVTSDGSESTYDATSGIHYGTNNANVTYLQLATSDINGQVSKVVVNARDAQAEASITVTVGSTSFTCGGNTSVTATNTSTDYTFTGTSSGEIVVRIDRGSSKAKAIYVKSVKVSYIPSTDPSVSADDVNIAYDVTGGSIAYTLTNEVTGGVLSATSSENWLTIGTVNSTAVPFTCSANEANTERTATVTLTYTYGNNETVTKDVTVTQAAAPVIYTTIPALFAAATTTAEEVLITFNNWVVSGVSTNGKNVFVTDNNGNGFVIFDNNGGLDSTYAVGNILSGTAVTCSLVKYNGFAELTNLDASNLTITSGGTVSTANVTMDNLAGVNTGALVSYDGLTCSVDNSGNTTKYYLSDGTTTIQVYNALYAFDALESGKTYNITGIYQQYNNTKEILPRSAADIEEVVVTTPIVTVSSNSLTGFTYVVGNGPSSAQTVSVSGTDLTADISLSLDNNSNFEMSTTEGSGYTNSLTLNQTNGTVAATTVYIRLKSGLAKAANYAGTITLTSADAADVTVNLSGSVTGQTYAINLNQPQNAGGSTISADKAAAEDGDEVTLTATPATGYSFYAWTVLDGNADEVTVTNNKFTMPASAVEVEGSFTQNNYAITVASASNGTVAVTGNITTAHYGDNVSFTATPSTDYQVKSYAVTETGGEGTATVTEDNGTYSFSMPAYPVTITVEFEEIPETYNGQGTFCKISSLDDLEDGGYYVLYGVANQNNQRAMNNTCSSHKMGATSVTFTGDNIVNPSTSIVWKLEKRVVSNNTYWDLYNEAAEAYCYIYTNNTSGFEMGANPGNNYYSVSVDEGEFSFVGQYGRMISIYTDDFRCYTSSNALPLYLYKLMPPSVDPAITVANSTVVVPATGGTDNLAITLSNMTVTGANDFSIQYYDENEDAISAPAWMNNVSVTASGDDYVISYIIAQNDDADRTAKLKVQATVNSQLVESNMVTFTQVRYVAPVTYTLVNSITPGKTYIIASGTDGSVKAMGSQGNNNRAAVSVEATTVGSTTSISVTNEDVYEFVVYGPDASGYYTLYDKTNSKYLYAIENSNYLKTQETNKNSGKWTISFGENSEAIITAPNVVKDNDARVMRYNSGNTLFSCYLSSQDNIYLYEKDGDAAETTTASVTLNGSGYATYANASTLDFLDNEDASYSAWQITSISGETITFTQVTETVIPATGLLLKGAASTSVNLNLLPVGGADLSTSNMLVGTTEATDFAQDAIYGLAGNTFKKNYAGTFPANKAYIPASSVDAVRSFTFVFVDPTTGITETRNVSAEEFGEVFNLAGQRMSKPQKGVNIINGKKVLVK